MTDECIAELQKGESSWNEWRRVNRQNRVSLRDVDFASEFPNKGNIYSLPYFIGADFSNCDLHGASLRNGSYLSCMFDYSEMNWADLVDAYFSECTFRNVSMRVSKIGSATFSKCTFEQADLSYCSAEEADFSGSTFNNTRLEHMSLVKCNFQNSHLDTCFVYGTATWDLNLDGSIQEDLIITDGESDIITVDNLELAQFIYLLINNQKLRNVIETITSKVVLILGNFSPKRKSVLNYIKSVLRKHDYIPVLFDFEKPSSRNFTETILTLAGMSKFIIADLSSPRSIGHELSALIPRMQSVNVYPIITESEEPYTMFTDFNIYTTVKKLRRYVERDVHSTVIEIIDEDQKKIV